jgi:hypothetical protein
MRETTSKAQPSRSRAKARSTGTAPKARGRASASKRQAASAEPPLLADPLSDLARTAPALLESLRGLPEALAPLERATLALSEIAGGLEHAQASLQDAVFHLPRPSEYEPLAEPLRDFARLVPTLIGSLETAPRLVASLVAVTQRVEAAVERIEARPAPASPTANAEASLSPDLLALRLDRIARAIEAARDAIRDALASLPTPDRYAPVARQLKELASVSPSLMDWMREVPPLATPLADAVGALNAAADELDGAFVDVTLTRRDIDALKSSN